jgi:hypothetical protein
MQKCEECIAEYLGMAKAAVPAAVPVSGNGD